MAGVRQNPADKSTLLSNLITLATAIGDNESVKSLRSSGFELEAPESVHGQMAVQLLKLCTDKMKLKPSHKFVCAV